MSGIGNEILVIIFLIVVSGFLAMSEMAVITARKSQLQDWIKIGHRRAQIALDLALAPNQFLSTVQAGATLLCVLAGAFAGRSIAGWIAEYAKAIPFISSYHQEIGLVAAVLSITVPSRRIRPASRRDSGPCRPVACAAPVSGCRAPSGPQG